MGPPGAGKGTQAKILATEFNLRHLSTGDILREEIRNQSEIGLDAQKFMDAGNLVPDNILLTMMENKLTELNKHGIILDGFPRTIPQAEGLSIIFKNLNSKIDYVINIDVEENALISRLIERAKNSGRADDTKEVIIKRQQVYRELTEPLIKYYSNEIIQVDGDGTIEEVTKRILQRIN